ncbi:MAG: Hpt domain-containing protein [Paracoccaceae bacterium]|nr:Hpt domain-containing protein [Paracoccaceae bacterium]MDE3121915.1 Hpt domain-containing protein [Paracoccaceae bacterium]
MSIQSALAGIRMRCVAQMAETLPRLLELRAALDQPGDSRAHLDEIRFAAHKSAGVAETLGFRRLGKLAQTLDQGLSDHLGRATPGPMPLTLAFLLDEYLSEMAAIVAAEACPSGASQDPV